VFDFHQYTDPQMTAFVAVQACLWEAMARKVGNVHPSAAFADLDFSHFVYSAVTLGARAASDPSALEHGVVGIAISHFTHPIRLKAVPNTNLGISLLLVPLMCVRDESVYESMPKSATQVARYEHRPRLSAILGALTVPDAVHVFNTIREINPGGLGDAPEQDVHSEPTVTLLEAMKLAADRDLIARQYANGYADVFDLGVPAFVAAFEKFGCVEAAVIECQLKWMAAFPDSLIARKLGLPAAEDVQRRVQHVLSLGGLDTPAGRQAGVELDAYLRSNGNKLNPGTTADLVAACLFVALRENKVKPSAPFRWTVPDWL
jgi:triphosphoribosyl-dephospho-CoA synthase